MEDAKIYGKLLLLEEREQYEQTTYHRVKYVRMRVCPDPFFPVGLGFSASEKRSEKSFMMMIWRRKQKSLMALNASSIVIFRNSSLG